jgi:Uma2 family endonuclease
MSVLTEARLWPIEDRPLTVDDLARTPDDGNRYELVNGVLVVTRAPGFTHQLVATRLTFLLVLHCTAGFDVVSPVGLNLAPDHHRIPDLAVLRTDQVLPGMEYPDTPPALVVEVASPITAKQDRSSKKDEYAAFGIESYWLVTPDRRRPVLTAYQLSGGCYEPVAVVSGEDTFRTEMPFPFSVVPALLVADNARWTAALPRG